VLDEFLAERRAEAEAVLKADNALSEAEKQLEGERRIPVLSLLSSPPHPSLCPLGTRGISQRSHVPGAMSPGDSSWLPRVLWESLQGHLMMAPSLEESPPPGTSHRVPTSLGVSQHSLVTPQIVPFSVLTAVGLLPIAVAGIDIDKLMEGAAKAREDFSDPDMTKNDAYKYAALRNILYRKGYTTELLENYEPNLQYFGEWWKQLMGESEGKDQKGIYPSSANFSTDLHSLGQYIQEGRRNLMETVVIIDKPRFEMEIPSEKDNLDGLGYLEGKSMDYVNKRAYEGVVLAHTDGGVPVMSVHIPEQDSFSLGYLIYFFEIAVGISGYLNGINPFNQPGVEAYKKNMFALLGKPGFEELGKELNERL